MIEIMREEYLIKQWLDNELTSEELAEFKQLEAYDSYVKLSDNAPYFKAPTFDKEATYSKVKTHISEKRLKKSKLIKLRPFIQIAAVLVVGILIYTSFFKSTLTIEQTLAQQKISVQLPDASVVELNSLSTISFNESEWYSDRHVNLDGEAFFKVAKGSKFDVETSLGVVTVVGTQFNVKNRDNYFEVKCFEGLVKVTYLNVEYLLPAGKTIRVINKVINQNSTALERPTWMNNFSSFESVPLSEVLSELERQYNFKVDVPENFNQSLLFSGTFVHNSKHLAIQSIAYPFNLEYTIINNRVIFEKFE